MRILQAHNFYQQSGGEDTVVAAEADLLRRHGDEVITYNVHNDAIRDMRGLAAAKTTIWNTRTQSDITRLIAEHKPDVLHSHNTFPLISPSLYGAAQRAGVPVVQTLHNYRLLCPAATFYRDGHVCEDCLGKPPISSVLHACYRGSRPATAVTAVMLVTHRALGTYRNDVDCYIALSEFARTKFIEGGLPANKIVVKPNFLSEDPGIGPGDGHYALFAGRLIEYKGVRTLLEAWRDVALPLKIAGSGPLLEEVTQRAAGMPNVEVLGSCSRPQVIQLLKSARALIFPSEWYEGMPMSLLEAYACGTPAIVSDLPSLHEFAESDVNAVRFRMGDPADLARQAASLFGNPQRVSRLRQGARHTYETRFSAEINYPLIREIYQQLIEIRQKACGFA